jgi:methyl coenzyme M reductase subunit D
VSNKEFTNAYVSLAKEDDSFIDKLRIQKIKQEKKHFTKNDVIKELIHLGMDVINGKYLKLDPSIDDFISQLQDMKVEMGNETVTIKKSKEQVYNMIIEKGLQHLND